MQVWTFVYTPALETIELLRAVVWAKYFSYSMQNIITGFFPKSQRKQQEAAGLNSVMQCDLGNVYTSTESCGMVKLRTTMNNFDIAVDGHIVLFRFILIL